jgi:hypothetical protein
MRFDQAVAHPSPLSITVDQHWLASKKRCSLRHHRSKTNAGGIHSYGEAISPGTDAAHTQGEYVCGRCKDGFSTRTGIRRRVEPVKSHLFHNRANECEALRARRMAEPHDVGLREGASIPERRPFPGRDGIPPIPGALIRSARARARTHTHTHTHNYSNLDHLRCFDITPKFAASEGSCSQ